MYGPKGICEAIFLDLFIIDGITNITPSYNKLVVSFDLDITDFSKIKKIIENLEIKKKVINKKI